MYFHCLWLSCVVKANDRIASSFIVRSLYIWIAYIVQIYSGITRGRVCSMGSFIHKYYRIRNWFKHMLFITRHEQKLIYIHEDFPPILGSRGLERNLHETVCRQIQIN